MDVEEDTKFELEADVSLSLSIRDSPIGHPGLERLREIFPVVKENLSERSCADLLRNRQPRDVRESLEKLLLHHR